MMVLKGVGWDRKEFPESNLHVYGKDDTKIVIYSMGRCTREGEENEIIWNNKRINFCNFVHQ